MLLIACANVANLLLARAPARRREIAIRAALGAGRGRVVRQLLAESLLLGALGGVAGLAAGKAGLALLVARLLAGIPRAEEIRMDAGALAFTLALAVFTGLACSVAPAVETSRADLAAALQESGRRHRLRSALVVVEVALSLVLLIGATLLGRSFLRLMETDPGFRAERAPMARAGPPFSGRCWRISAACRR